MAPGVERWATASASGLCNVMYIIWKEPSSGTFEGEGSRCPFSPQSIRAAAIRSYGDASWSIFLDAICFTRQSAAFLSCFYLFSFSFWVETRTMIPEEGYLVSVFPPFFFLFSSCLPDRCILCVYFVCTLLVLVIECLSPGKK